MQRTYDLFSAVNNQAVYERDLLASPDVRAGLVQPRAVRDARCAGEAYNRLLRQGDAPIAIFAHQDVYLPAGWFARLDRLIDSLPDPNWGVLGVWGVNQLGQPHGHVYCNSAGRVLDRGTPDYAPTVSLDELLLIVNRESGLVFDEALPSFHLYGTDIVLSALASGRSAYSLRLPTIHNSRTWIQLDRGYRRAYDFMRRKWKAQLPLPTCVVPLRRARWPLYKRAIRMHLGVLCGRRMVHKPIGDPGELSRHLQWDHEPSESLGELIR